MQTRADLSRLVLEIDSNGVVKASGNLDIFKKKAEQVEKQTGSLDDALKNLDLAFLAGTAGCIELYKMLMKLIGGMKNFAQASLQTYAHFEKMQMGLEIFYHSAEKGKAVFEDLRKLSLRTTFGVDELAEGASQLLNVGVASRELNKTLLMLGDIAVGDKEKFAELTTVYAKIQSMGKAGARQLMQLAVRGVPIYRVLKEIGVQGTATASDITKAFEAMTGASGQFYDAMRLQNETIQGKEGYIRDYFNEFKVNFAEVTGLAEAYKNILTSLKEAIGNVSDWLLKINENPLSKAIFNGALIGSITAVVSIIGGTLIFALNKVIAKLGIILALKTAINPTKLLIGLGAGLAVGGLTGIVSYLSNIEKKADDAKKSVSELQQAIARGDKKTATTLMIDELTAKKTKLEAEIKALQQGAYDENGKKIHTVTDKESAGMLYIGTNIDVDAIKREVEGINEEIQHYQSILDEIQRKATAQDILKTTTDQLNEQYLKIEELNEQLEALDYLIKSDEEELKKFEEFHLSGESFEGLSDEIKKQIDEAKEYIQKQVVDLKVKIAIEKGADWQKSLQKALGLTDKQAVNLNATTMKNGTQQVDEFKEKYKNYRESDLGNITDKNNEYLGDITKVLETLQQANKELTGSDSFSKDDKSVKELLLEAMNIKDDQFNDLGGVKYQNANDGQKKTLENLKETYEKLKSVVGENYKGMEEFKQKLIDAGMELDEVFKNTLPTSLNELITTSVANITKSDAYPNGAQVSLGSTDVDAAMQGFATGGIWGAIIGTLVNALYKVCQGIEGFDTVLNPVTTILQKLTPFIRDLTRFIAIINKIIFTLADLLRALYYVISPVIDLFLDLFEWISNGLSWFIHDVLGIEELADEEKDKQSDLTDAYKSLLDAMKEVEEYYDTRKAIIRGEQAIVDAPTKSKSVHDMILTPQGNFSTDPDDYIIATKNPSGLNGGGKGGNVIMNVKINNTVSDKVEANVTQRTSENGVSEMIVQISQKIASDFARGSNGWESAYSYRQARIQGRSVSL